MEDITSAASGVEGPGNGGTGEHGAARADPGG